jgi:predicted SAM-dependent methyltransferase
VVRALHRFLKRGGSWLKDLERRQARLRLREGVRAFEAPYRLHLGCGKIRLDGWINVDFEASEGITDAVWDLRYPLPLPDGSCALIYSEHLLEHLRVDDGVALLRDGHRLVREGGVLRCAMPSLDRLIEQSFTGDWRQQDWLTWPEYKFIQTRAEMLNIAFRWWGHQWLYDREELHRRLHEAGFSKIRDVEWGVSEIADLQGLEARRDSCLICEAER